mgnify:CR=1 FL=1
MSFSTNGSVVIADSTPADVTYSEVQNTGTSCTYSDRSREIGEPRKLIISHQTSGSGDDLKVRSLCKLTNAIENPSLEGDVVEHGIHIVFDTPQRVIAKADITDVLTQMINLVSDSSFVDKITNQEV